MIVSISCGSNLIQLLNSSLQLKDNIISNITLDIYL